VELSAYFGKIAGCGLLALFAAAAVAPQDGAAAARKVTGRKAPPAGPRCPVSGTAMASLAKVLDGETFLTADGREVRLAGVLAQGAGGEAALSPLTATARANLAAALNGGAITIAPVEDAPDRYGRILAQVFAGDAWVQGSLLQAGAVRMAPDRAASPCAKQLIAAEEKARADRAGHWGDGVFSLRTPEQVKSRAGSFQAVEGMVTTATTYKGRAYINFGPDYRTDFTVTVAPADMKLFRAARFDVKGLAGKRVRVRGWVELYNGPEMQIATPAAIEMLDERRD
jgi:endonuclease YncB( thermonuclease family)